MLEYSVQPIKKWPGERKGSYRFSQFRSTWPRTLDILEEELEKLDATDVVIQLDCDRSQLTNNAKMKAGVNPRTPAVILSFESKHGPMSYPCETYSKWQNNIHAIALSLAALRAVDRYGVTRGKEQYQGWLALEDKTAQGPFADRGEAVQWLVKEGVLPPGLVPSSDAECKSLRQRAMQTFAPDRNGGSDERWKLWRHAALKLGIEV